MAAGHDWGKWTRVWDNFFKGGLDLPDQKFSVQVNLSDNKVLICFGNDPNRPEVVVDLDPQAALSMAQEVRRAAELLTG